MNRPPETLGELEMFLDEHGAEIFVPTTTESRPVSLEELTRTDPKQAEAMRAQFRTRFIDTGWIPTPVGRIANALVEGRPLTIALANGTEYAVDLERPFEDCSICKDPTRPAYVCVACREAGDAQRRFCSMCGPKHCHPAPRPGAH